ncbi:hypothetical protein [Sulfuricurvum sp.]|uniref:hypothetical protein n=1 Tax=Sulfuricurvum sp. TaxID=2025608 RepID=UPI00356A64EC
MSSSQQRKRDDDDIDNILDTMPRPTDNNRWGLVPIIDSELDTENDSDFEGMGATSTPAITNPFEFSTAKFQDFPKLGSLPKMSVPKITVPKVFKSDSDRKNASKWLTMTTVLNPLKGMSAIMSLFWDNVVAGKIEKAIEDALGPIPKGINDIIAQIDKEGKQVGDFIGGNFKALDLNQLKNIKGLDFNVNTGLKTIDEEFKKSITALGSGMSDLTTQATKYLNDSLSSKISMVPVDVNKFVQEQFNVAIPEIRKISPELQNFTREDNIKIMNQQLDLTKSQTATLIEEMKATQKEMIKALPTLVANETFNTLKQKGFGNLKITGLDGKPIALPVSMSGDAGSLWATDVLDMKKHMNHMKQIFAKQGIRLSDDQAKTMLNSISFKLPEQFTNAIQTSNIKIPAIPKMTMPAITLPSALRTYIPQVNFALDMNANIQRDPMTGFNKRIEQLERQGWKHAGQGQKNQVINQVRQYRKAGAQVIQLNIPGQKNMVDVWVLPNRRSPIAQPGRRSVPSGTVAVPRNTGTVAMSGGLYSDSYNTGDSLFKDDSGPHEPIYRDKADFRTGELIGDDYPSMGASPEAFRRAKQVRAENIKKRREAKRQARITRQKRIQDARSNMSKRRTKTTGFSGDYPMDLELGFDYGIGKNRKPMVSRPSVSPRGKKSQIHRVRISSDYPVDLEGDYGYRPMGITAYQAAQAAIAKKKAFQAAKKPAPKPAAKKSTSKPAAKKPAPKPAAKKTTPKPVAKKSVNAYQAAQAEIARRKASQAAKKPASSAQVRPQISQQAQQAFNQRVATDTAKKPSILSTLFKKKPTTTSTSSRPVQESSYAYMQAGKIWAPGTRSHGMPDIDKVNQKPAKKPAAKKKSTFPKISLPKISIPKISLPKLTSKKKTEKTKATTTDKKTDFFDVLKKASAKKKMEEDRKKAKERIIAKPSSTTSTSDKASPFTLLKQAIQKKSEEKRLSMVAERKTKLIDSANTKYANDPARLALELKYIESGATAQQITDKAERLRQTKLLAEQRQQGIQQLRPPSPVVPATTPTTEPALTVPEAAPEEQPIVPIPEMFQLPDMSTITQTPTTSLIPTYETPSSSAQSSYPTYPTYQQPETPSYQPETTPTYEPYQPAAIPELPEMPAWTTTEQEPTEETEQEPEPEQIITLPETTVQQPSVQPVSMIPQISSPFDIGGFLSGITASFTNIFNQITGQGQTQAQVPEETVPTEADYPYDLEDDFDFGKGPARRQASRRRR